MNNHYASSVTPEGVAVPRFILSSSQQHQLAEFFHLKQQQDFQQQLLYQNFQQQLQALQQQHQHEIKVSESCDRYPSSPNIHIQILQTIF